ncbi:MAG: hypothetical protein WC802_01530 [Patescibacteria group bacterium]|jgi:hypothetical protein
MTLQEIIETNRVRQQRAHELNRRAGAVVLPVLSREEMETWLMARLQGARRAAEIADLSALLLPALDAEVEGEVLRSNPDTIALLGREHPVEYRADYYGRPQAPQVTLSHECGEHAWRDLPDTGVTLPGGRAVEVNVVVNYYEFAETSVPALKGKVLTHLNQEQWNSWVRPEIPLPTEQDLRDDDHVVPFEVVAYGHCLVTGAKLRAYGTLTPKAYRYYGTDPYFEAAWYRDPTEAQQAASASAEKLCELFVELKKKAEKEAEDARLKAEEDAIRASAEALRSEVYAIYSRLAFGVSLPDGMREELSVKAGYSLPSGLGELKTWAEETKSLCARALSAEAAAKVAEERRLEEARLAKEVEEHEYAPIFEALPGIQLDWARSIRAFAEVMAEGRGPAEAVKLLEKEYSASYGRGGRQEAMRRLRSVRESDVGARFLGFARARDVDEWLFGAVAWLKSRASAKQAVKPPASSPATTAPQPAVKPATASVEPGKLDLSGLFGGGVMVTKRK